MSEPETLSSQEQRIRALIAANLATIISGYGGGLASAVAAGTVTIHEILSRPELHRSLLAALTSSRTAAEQAIRDAYQAAAALARDDVTKELAPHGYTVSEELPPLGGHLDAIIATVAAAYLMAQLDIVETVRTAYLGVTGIGQRAAGVRALIITEAVTRAVRRLSVRVTAAGTVAVHRGYTDAQNALYNAYADANPHLTITKTWRAHSARPCAHCAALDGTTIALDAEFDRTAGTASGGTPLRVFRDLHGPPRHPNCRCRIELSASAATRAYQRKTNTTPSGIPSRLSAAQVRQMPPAQYAALTAFLTAALRRLRRLLARIRRGG